MKLRVFKVTRHECIHYFPQFRFLYLWWGFLDRYDNTTRFSHLDDAIAYIRNINKRVEVIPHS